MLERESCQLFARHFHVIFGRPALPRILPHFMNPNTCEYFILYVCHCIKPHHRCPSTQARAHRPSHVCRVQPAFACLQLARALEKQGGFEGKRGSLLLSTCFFIVGNAWRIVSLKRLQSDTVVAIHQNGSRSSESSVLHLRSR